MSKKTAVIDTKNTLNVNDKIYSYYAINRGELAGNKLIERLPVSIKVLLENLLRHQHDKSCSRKDIETLAASQGHGSANEISYNPARVLMQDFTGVPALVDLAAMRDALVKQ